MFGSGLTLWQPAIYNYGAGVAAFTPASLFTAGQLGAWYDPSDMATLYQDSAGTTAVTAATQPVGKLLDKSGRSNHEIQATAAARPVLGTTGAQYLTFDGVDDGLSTGAITLGADMDCFVALKRNVSAMMLFTSAFGAGDYAFLMADGSSNTGTSTGIGSPTYAANGVDVAGGTSPTRGQLAAASPMGSWVIFEVRNANLSAWTALHTSTYPGFVFNGDIGGVILSPAGDAAQRAKIRTFLGAKVGLTL